MNPSMRSGRIPTLALIGLTLLSPLGADRSEAGVLSDLWGKAKDKIQDKFREVTNPQFLLQKVAEKLGKKGTPVALPPQPVAPPPAAPAPVAPVAPQGTQIFGTPAIVAPQAARPADCPQVSSIPSRSLRAQYPHCFGDDAGRVVPQVINPVVESSQDEETSTRELALRLIRLGEQMLGRTYGVAAERATRAADASVRRSLADFRQATRLEGAALKARHVERMTRLGGQAELRAELAGDAEGARPEGPEATTAAEKTYAKLEQAAREASLRAAVETFRKGRQVALAKARKLIAEYQRKLGDEARAEMDREFRQALARNLSRREADQIARAALKAAHAANAEKLEEYRRKVTDEALEDARSEAWQAAERTYATEEASAHRVAVEIDELMSATGEDGQPSKGAAQQARVAEREASVKLQMAAKDVAGIFGVGFQGVPAY